MDLSGLGARVRRWATPCPLVIAAPGAHRCRWAVEQQLRLRGWGQAASPAEADLLVVCGTPGPRLADAVEQVWQQLPTPRARAQVAKPGAAPSALDGAHAELSDPAWHRRDLATRSHGPADGHMPGGLDMADRGADRDGLTLDQLHPVLGPVLPDWPAGLQLRVTMQGDVLQQVQAELLDVTSPFPPEDDRVLAWDCLARLLGVLGWNPAAVSARRVRDEVLKGRPVDPSRLVRRLRRSRSLCWSTDRLGVLPDAFGLAQEVTGRWQHWLDVVAGDAGLTRVSLDDAVAVLPDLLTGTELGTARIVVASLPLEAVTARAAVAHG